MNVPYRFGEGGSAILVPADQVYELRMKLGLRPACPRAATPATSSLDKVAALRPHPAAASR